MAGTEAALRIVVCDAGPLIHLDELGCITLLADFERILVPSVVWAEVLRHRPAVFSRTDVSLEQVTPTLPPADDIAAVARTLSLDSGEIEAILVYREFGAQLMLSDDTAARLAARHLDIRVHGTLGIVLRSIRTGRLSAAAVIELLRGLPDHSTLHVRRTLLDDIIKDVEKLL